MNKTEIINERRRELDRAYHDQIGCEYDGVILDPRRTASDILFNELALPPPSPNSRMLDCGCGTGQAILRFGLTDNNYTTIIGIDHSQGMLDSARRKLNERQAARVSLIQTDVMEWLAGGETTDFDLITAIGILHHLSDEQVGRALKLMAKHVKPGGQIVIAEPMFDNRLLEPGVIRLWNRHSLARGASYSTPAEEPEERPLPRELLYEAFDGADLRILAHASSWEIFNRSARPGWLERRMIGWLYLWGGPGIVNAWRLQPSECANAT